MIFLPLGTQLAPKKKPIVTIGIILLNTLIYFYLNSLDQEEQWGTILFYGWVPKEPNLSGLLCSGFIHLEGLHLLANMIYLWTFGAYLETVIGWKRFLVYYLGADWAGNFLYAFMTAVYYPGSFSSHSIGASGAVSGIMAVCLIRCYYNKIYVGVSLFGLFSFIPKRFGVPAVIFIGDYILENFYWGFSTLGDPYVRICHWAHIGGFLFGAAAGIGLKEHLQARLDHCRLRADYWLRKGMGLDQVRQDLQTIVQGDPRDAWAMVDLARVESKNEQREKGLELYRRAILTFWKHGERQWAAMIFAEFFRKYCPVTFGLLPFGLCRELIRMGEPEIAARALKQFIEERKGRPQGRYAFRLETAYWLLAELLGEKLNQPRSAGKVWQASLGRFPESGYREAAEKKLRLMAQAALA